MAFEKAKVLKAAEKFLSQGKINAAIKEYRQIVDNDADDLTRRLSERSTEARCLLQPVPQGVSFWPVLLRHGLIDDDDSRSGGIVVISKRAAPKKRNL